MCTKKIDWTKPIRKVSDKSVAKLLHIKTKFDEYSAEGRYVVLVEERGVEKVWFLNEHGSRLIENVPPPKKKVTMTVALFQHTQSAPVFVFNCESAAAKSGIYKQISPTHTFEFEVDL